MCTSSRRDTFENELSVCARARVFVCVHLHIEIPLKTSSLRSCMRYLEMALSELFSSSSRSICARTSPPPCTPCHHPPSGSVNLPHPQPPTPLTQVLFLLVFLFLKRSLRAGRQPKSSLEMRMSLFAPEQTKTSSSRARLSIQKERSQHPKKKDEILWSVWQNPVWKLV